MGGCVDSPGGEAAPDAFVLAFESTHAAMAAMSTLDASGTRYAVIPTPREISAGCGMSLRFAPELLADVREQLGLPDGAPLAALYEVAGRAYTRV